MKYITLSDSNENFMLFVNKFSNDEMISCGVSSTLYVNICETYIDRFYKLIE
jgi:hypothetical protein